MNVIHISEGKECCNNTQKTGGSNVVFEDDFEDENLAPWSVNYGQSATISGGMLEVILDHGISFPAVQAPFPAQSEENYELSFSKLVKVLHDPFYVGIASPTGEVLKEVLVDDIGFMTMIFRPTQTGNHYIYVRSSGVSSAQESSVYTVAIDDVLIRNISQEGYSLLGYSDYFPFGMPMPNRNVEGDYRYAFQGQEKDPETGKEAFELRLWDSRIGRWLTTDPAGQYSSPYLGMGNNPISRIDPDGGFDYYRDADGNIVYDENIRGEQEFLDSGIDGVYLGITYQKITETSNTYYSIFGEVVDANTLEGRLYQKFDEAIFKYGTAYQPEGDGMVTATNFDLGIKFHSGVISSSADNLYEFNYYGGRGYYHVFGNTTAMKGRLDRGSGEFSKNSNYGFFPLRDGYNVSISNSGDFKIVFIVFPTKEQYQRYNNAINYEFFGKTNPSPRTFVVKQGFSKFKN